MWSVGCKLIIKTAVSLHRIGLPLLNESSLGFAYAASDYVKTEFTSVEVNGEIRSQFALCLEVLVHACSRSEKLNYVGISSKNMLNNLTKTLSFLKIRNTR